MLNNLQVLRGLFALQTKTSAAYSLSAFFSGRQGGAWDPSDITSLFQDTAGTVPVTAAGQPVARMNDKSGNGWHALQATTTKRPLYNVDGGGRGNLVGDNVDDGLAVANFDMSAFTLVNVWAGFRKASDALRGIVYEHSNSTAVNIGFSLGAPNGTAAANVGAGHNGGTGIITASGSGAAPISLVTCSTYDLATTIVNLRMNGVQTAFNSGLTGPGPFSIAQLSLMSRANGTGLPFSGNFYGLVIRGGAATADEIKKTETWLNARTGAY